MKRKLSRHRGESEDERVGSQVAASSGLPEAHLAAHLCDTQWMKGGWPPWGGCPPAAWQRAAGAMFVGIGIMMISQEQVPIKGTNTCQMVAFVRLDHSKT